MTRMKLLTALATALLVGTTPSMAADSPMISAAESANESASAHTMHSASVSVAEAVVEASESAAASQSESPAESDAENQLTESTPATPSSGLPLPSAGTGSESDHWRDAIAERGEVLRVPFEGDTTFENLQVTVSSAFQNFRAQVLPDQSILVFVPHFFTGASQVSPVFTVSDEQGEIDTFSVSVEYPRPLTDTDERTSPLFRLIVETAVHLPQLPFLRHLFED